MNYEINIENYLEYHPLKVKNKSRKQLINIGDYLKYNSLKYDLYLHFEHLIYLTNY